MKHLPLFLAIVLAIALVLSFQSRITANPGGSPRSVPIIVQDVMPPSKMVAIGWDLPVGATEQITIPLIEGQVFVLTSWTANGYLDNIVELSQGPSFDTQSRRGYAIMANGTNTYHFVLPAGIRFPRDANGNADLWATRKKAGGSPMRLVFQGYITDDF